MTVPTIHAHSHSDKATIQYVTFMWDTMRSLANHPEALKLTVHCIGPTATERLSTLTNAQTFFVPNTDGGVGGQGGSMAHGVCVEHALAMTDDGDIHLNVDSDTVVLAKGWDDYVRLALLDRGVGIIGATFEDIGGFSSGNSNSQMFKKIPYTAWLAMSPAHRWQDLKVLPNKGNEIIIANEGLSKVYNLPVGYHAMCDVGWQIPEYLHSRGITYEGWKQLKGSKDAVVLKGLNDYHEEYHVEGTPFVVHQRGSLRHAYRGGDVSGPFYKAVDKWLEAELTHEPRWTWQPNEANAAILAQMKAIADDPKTKARIDDFVARGRALPAPSTVVGPPPSFEAVSAVAGPGGTLSGWLKATMNGTNVWSRYAASCPAELALTYSPDGTFKHVRLEGTVTGLTVNLPPASDSKAHALTIRNLLPASVVVQIPELKRTLNVPSGECWSVLADVDGVTHIT